MLARFPSKIAGVIPAIPPEEEFLVGLVVVVLTDIAGGSRGSIPWSIAVRSSPVVMVSSDEGRSGIIEFGGSTVIGWWVLVSSAVWV